jgi:DNA-binding GntR family transcriptional regulator
MSQNPENSSNGWPSFGEHVNKWKIPVLIGLIYWGHVTNRGAEVASPSSIDLHDMFQVMADLEGLCAGYAARAMLPAERDMLEQSHQRMATIVRSGDSVAYTEANEALHALIYAGTHNSYLVEITTKTRTRLRPYRRAQFSTLGRLTASHAEHEAIVQAILRGDRIAAQRTMMEHILVVRDAFLRLAADSDADLTEQLGRLENSPA